MTPRKSSAPIFERNGRWYLDARAWADVGGRKQPLIPAEEKLATRDPVVARALATTIIQGYEEKRRNRALLGVERTATLSEYAAYHLAEKAKEGAVTDAWMDQAQRHLQHALDYFGADRDLASIRVADVQAYAGWLAKQKDRRKRLLSGGTRRQYLNSLSNLFKRAAGEGYVKPGANPVAALMHKPSARRLEARWLEVHEAALLLESARTWKPKRTDTALPFAHVLIATFLLTGGRETEVLGLEVSDVSFDRGTVTFRPNQWRRLKTRTSHRTVPLHPQLREILQAYVFAGESPMAAGLLFPSHRAPKREEKDAPTQAMLTDFRKPLDAIAERAGWKPGEIRSKQFRHTFTAARLQTLDRGAPISPWTVARELGHGGRDLVDRVYGHLGTLRHRSEHVEYILADHLEVPGLAERARNLQRA